MADEIAGNDDGGASVGLPLFDLVSLVSMQQSRAGSRPAQTSGHACLHLVLCFYFVPGSSPQ